MTTAEAEFAENQKLDISMPQVQLQGKSTDCSQQDDPPPPPPTKSPLPVNKLHKIQQLKARSLDVSITVQDLETEPGKPISYMQFVKQIDAAPEAAQKPKTKPKPGAKKMTLLEGMRFCLPFILSHCGVKRELAGLKLVENMNHIVQMEYFCANLHAELELKDIFEFCKKVVQLSVAGWPGLWLLFDLDDD